jgi:hypothetical protein
MKFEFICSENDYLMNTLFWVSRSKEATKSRRINVLVRVLLFLVAAFSAYMNNSFYVAGFALSCALAIVFLYPIYQRSFYKKSYLKYIRTIYKDRIGKMLTIDFKEDVVWTKDETGESEMNLSEIVEVHETGDYFFIKFNSGDALFLPKDRVQVGDFLTVMDRLSAQYQLKMDKALYWVWK